MVVYILLAGIVGILALYETGQKTKRDMILFQICLVAFLLVVGLRYGHGDYHTYEWGYNNRVDISGDKGYYQLNLFFEWLGLSFPVFVFIITIFSVFAFSKTYRLTAWPVFGMAVILGKFFTLYAMSGIRQYIAMAICWWAISELLLNKRRLLFLLMVSFAFTLHASAIIVLPVYFFRNIKFSYKIAFLILIVSTIFGIGWRFFFEQLMGASDLVEDRFGAYYRYTVYHGGGSMNMINYVENFLFLFLALVVRKNKNQKNCYYDFFLYMFIIYCGFLIAGSEVGAVKRIRDYYGIAYAMIVPYFVYIFKRKSDQKLFKAILIAYFILLLFRSMSVYDSGIIPGTPYRMVPYNSVLMSLE